MAAPDLPPYTALGAPDFSWGWLSGHDFVHAVTAAYAEAVHWRRNIFSVPSGKAGKDFVQELSRLFRSYAERSSMECIALKATIRLISEEGKVGLLSLDDIVPGSGGSTVRDVLSAKHPPA